MRVLALPLIFMMSLTSAHAEPGSNSVKTDDICAVSPDMCKGTSFKKKRKKRELGTPLDFADFEDAKSGKTAKVQKHVKKKKSKKQQGPVQDDFWEKEIVDDVIELDIDGPRPAPAPKRAAAPKFKRPKISFASYMSANHTHRAIGGYTGPMQDAFSQSNRPVSYSDPGTGQSVRENTTAAVPPTDAPTIPPNSN